MSAQVAADLRAAAEVLRRDGWTQRTVGSCYGRKCVLGAINYVATKGQAVGDDEIEKDDDFVRATLAERAVSEFVHRAVVAYNDAPGRTADEVIAALEAAADAAERGAE